MNPDIATIEEPSQSQLVDIIVGHLSAHDDEEVSLCPESLLATDHRGLSLGQVSSSNLRWLCDQELVIGLLNGAL